MIFEFEPWADRHPEEQSKARVSSALFRSLQTTTSGTLPRAKKVHAWEYGRLGASLRFEYFAFGSN